MELCNLTCEELETLLESCQEELERRQREKLETLWNNVALSIKEFQQQVDVIEIHDILCDDLLLYLSNADFSEIGHIKINIDE